MASALAPFAQKKMARMWRRPEKLKKKLF